MYVSAIFSVGLFVVAGVSSVLFWFIGMSSLGGSFWRRFERYDTR
jgi:hypothetical protein